MDKLRKQVEAKNKGLSNLKQLETKLAETEVELSSLQESDKVCVWQLVHVHCTDCTYMHKVMYRYRYTYMYIRVHVHVCLYM